MRFGLLGSLEAWTDQGSSIDVGGAQPRIVLAMLLGASGRIVPVDALIEAIWGDAVPASASGTLQSYVSRLRREFEPQRTRGAQARVLRWEPPGYRLDVPAEAVDFRRFEQLADEGRALLAENRAEEASARLVDALALWRGPALLEFAGEEFARGLAARLEERRLAAIEDRVAADLALGRHAAVVGELTELVGAHPLQETLWGHLALALYRSGRQADALRCLDDMRAKLRDELGVDPSRPLRDLEAKILDQDPSLDFTRAEVAPVAATPARTVPASEPAPLPSIVGRESELAQLVGALDEVVAAQTRFAVVEGEPGIGKTRLLEELAAAARGRGAAVYWGHCHEGGAAPAFWPWLEVLRAVAADPAVQAALDDQLATLLAPSAGPAAGPPPDPYRLFEAVAQTLEHATAAAPVVVVIDDIQWADPASLELLEFLAGRIAASRLLLAVSVRERERTDAVVGALAALTRRPGTRRLQLHGLDVHETSVLVARATGVTPADAVVKAIHTRADGNPFFVGELARLVVADVATSDDELVERAGVPAGVRDVVRRRLARLADGTRDVLQAAAIIGREAELEVLARVSDRDVERCLDDLEAAIATGLLVEVPDVAATFRFAHALVREVVLEEVATLQRARLHRRAADAIVAVAGDTDDNAEIVAAHLWDAVSLGDRERAAGALERAAAVAVRRFAYESAETLLERTLQLRRAPADDPNALDAEFRAIAALARVRRARRGYVTTATSTPLSRARELAERTGRFDLLDELLWEEWAAAATSCELDTAGRLAAQMYEIGRASDDVRLQSLGESAWAIHSWHVGNISEAVQHIDEAVALDATVERAAEEGGALVEARLLTAGFQIAFHEFVDLDADGATRASAFAAAQADPYAQILAMDLGGLSGFLANDPARAAKLGRRALVVDPDCAFAFFTPACGLWLAWALGELGDNDEALALHERYLPIYTGIGVRTCVALLTSNHAVALARAGRDEEAGAQLAEAQRVLDTHGELWQAPFVAQARAHIARQHGAPADEVAAHLQQAVDVATSQGALAVAHRAAAALARVR